MNSKLISRVNEGIMETKVDLTYKEFVDLLAEIKNKDDEIKELREYVLIKEDINLLKDEKLLKNKNILPSNVRYKKDSFKISRLEKNTWYSSKYTDGKFEYELIRFKDDDIKKGFEEVENIKGYFDEENEKYFLVLRNEESI
ncbi:hypothetical protein [Clostridium perfringens]|uniref:hypothetical protein n=1 Tax=Clostridium perfringens TaxID=1502 RepID=UPI003CEFB4FE